MNELDKLFKSAILEDSDVDSVVADDLEDELFDLQGLEESRKISIFDSEFVLEGEV